MQLYSTNDPALRVSFREAIFNSLPEDKGLYMPVEIPELSASFLENIEHHTFAEIALEVAGKLIGDDIPGEDLKRIIDDAINFDAPVIEIGEGTGVLELFHGPSLAFKDFGARFMSRVMAYFRKEDEQVLDVLVATSGDTGGAVALGFLGVPGTRVTILYPKGKVSDVQELQLSTNGENIRAVEIEGTFDDCQALVKQAFNDPELKRRFRLTSANSINISRLIPQTFYYFFAWAQLKRKGLTELAFSVPSGNFGNLAAGVLAWKMGLPVSRFIAATNVNDTVPVFLETGNYRPKPSVQTWSNAMDVGDPSNWVRIRELFREAPAGLRDLLQGYSFSDEETLRAIEEVFHSSGYIMCPHTAVAWLGLKKWQESGGGAYGVLLSTAHPCKFPDIFPEGIRQRIGVPQAVRDLAAREKRKVVLDKRFENFKTYLLSDGE